MSIDNIVNDEDLEYIENLSREYGVDQELLTDMYKNILSEDLVYPRTALYNATMNEYRRNFKR